MDRYTAERKIERSNKSDLASCTTPQFVRFSLLRPDRADWRGKEKRLRRKLQQSNENSKKY